MAHAGRQKQFIYGTLLSLCQAKDFKVELNLSKYKIKGQPV